MKSVLVIDDMSVLREPMAGTLRSVGYDAHCAADGEEGLRLARSLHPDVILLDIAMPTMDGITFLKRLRSEPALQNTRVILLTVVSDSTTVLAARALGVKEYILKSRFRLDDLLKRIERSGAVAEHPEREPRTEKKGEKPGANVAAKRTSADIPKLVTRDEFLKRVESAFEAKTLSGVVAEVIAMASSSRGDTAQLAALISRDPLLSARVLQTANSASYASSGAVVMTIADAIRKVGYSAVRNIAAALGVFECLPEGETDGFNPIRCWQHSFAVAQLCERLATVAFPEKAGLAYVVGLCHDLGEIFMRTKFNKEYHQLVELAAETGRPKDELCGQIFGVTRAQMVSTVHKCMCLPDAICGPIELFHSPGGCDAEEPLTKILYIAENYANAMLLASTVDSEVAPLTQAFCRAAIREPHPARPDSKTMRADLFSLTVALARLSREDEKKLLAPMFQTRQANIWIARDAGISQFDPISTALESLTKTTVNDHLPGVGEGDRATGLLVIASANGIAGFARNDIESVAKSYRAAGRRFPTMAVAARRPAQAGQQETDAYWRSSITLSQLATFTEDAGSGVAHQAA